MTKAYKLYETDKTVKGISVRKARRGYKDVKVYLFNDENKGEYEVQYFDNSKDANKYAKQLIKTH